MLKKEAQKEQPSNIFEGMTSIRALLESINSGISDRKIVEIKYAKERFESIKKELSFLKHRAFEMGFSLTESTQEEIEDLTLGTTHGGLVAICTDRTIKSLELDDIKPGSFYVMIEGIEDPFNFGYALRSLYAAGVEDIILTERNWMNCAGVVCRSSAGTSELFKLHTSTSEAACELFKTAGYKIVCADKKNSVSIYNSDLKKPLFLLIGGEKRGISKKALDMADLIVHIDYGRDFSQSLSAASAASIVSFEIFRQNQ